MDQSRSVSRAFSLDARQQSIVIFILADVVLSVFLLVVGLMPRRCLWMQMGNGFNQEAQYNMKLQLKNHILNK